MRTEARSICAALGALVVAATIGVTRAAQEVPSTKQPAGKTVVEVKLHNGRPTLHINGEPNPLPTYSPVAWSRPHFTKAVPYFTKHPMAAYFLCFPGVRGQGWAGTQFWDGDNISNKPLIETLAPGSPSFEEQTSFILERDPEARFFVRGLPADPPSSWRKLHQDQRFVNEDGQAMKAPSLASDRYWNDLDRAAKATIEYVELQAWADRVLGYWVGMFGEGTYSPLYGYYLFDHSPVMTAKWRAFLKGRYKTIEALRQAYQNPALTFENATVPKDPLRGQQEQVASLLYWQNASENRLRRDYLELTAQLVHEGYRKVMAAAEEATGGRKLCLYDAFKQTMLGWNLHGFFVPKFSWWPAYPEMMTGGGYLRVATLFDAPGFDGLVTPHDYQARGIGGVYEPEGIVDSVILRGKYFLSEMDTRTYNIGHTDYGSARNDQEYAAVTWRNLATSFTRGFNSYWMDLCGGYAGWFGNEGIHKIITRQVEVVRQSLEWRHEDVPSIAMILDDTAVLETNGAGNFFNEAIMWEQKMGMARCGVPYRVYLLDDLKLPNFPAHRVFYFPNLFRVDDERLRLLREKVFRNGNVVLWGPGSGISDGEVIGATSATRLTGFEFDFIPANYQRRTLISNFDHPITQSLKADTIIGGPLAYGPMLFPKVPEGAADTQSLGFAWTKQGRNYSGLAVRTFGEGALGVYDGEAPRGEGDWASVFTTAIPIPADVWRGLARFAGAHVYCESNDILLADCSIVALHSIQSGPKRIDLPGTFRVTDVVTGKAVGDRLQSIEFDLRAPETRVFLLEPAR